MSNAIFPTLPGLAWAVRRTPLFKTVVQTAASGRETRTALWSSPRYQWELSYDVLRDTGASELRTLEGFFLARQGAFDAFLFDDPDDNTASAQALGSGDGATRVFQLLRSYGGFIEPVTAPAIIGSVYVDGVAQSAASYAVDPATGVLSFAAPPAAGTAISADFTYYWRVRFLEDTAAFEKFAFRLWQMKQLTLISVK